LKGGSKIPKFFAARQVNLESFVFVRFKPRRFPAAQQMDPKKETYGCETTFLVMMDDSRLQVTAVISHFSSFTRRTHQIISNPSSVTCF
jgi:hypothetical protein